MLLFVIHLCIFIYVAARIALTIYDIPSKYTKQITKFFRIVGVFVLLAVYFIIKIAVFILNLYYAKPIINVLYLIYYYVLSWDVSRDRSENPNNSYYVVWFCDALYALHVFYMYCVAGDFWFYVFMFVINLIITVIVLVVERAEQKSWWE